MLQFTKSLWNDEAGFVISAELALVSTLCVLGLVVGLSSVRDAVNCELTDLSTAICSLDQSYYYTGFHSRKWPGCCTTKAWTAGSAFIQPNKGCQSCYNGNYDVDFVTTSNVAPCQTCTTGSAVIATPAPAVVNPEPVRVIEQPKTESVPCPPAALPEVPAPQPTSFVCPPAAPVASVACPQPVSTTCPAPATCPTQSSCSAPVGGCSAPVVGQPACGVVVPAARPVLVPQRQLITW